CLMYSINVAIYKYYHFYLFVFFFFFQAEDGIRDRNVTGVQTCALPIFSYLSIGLSGIYGTFLGISANQVYLFVIFGALLGVIKVNDFFFEAGKIAGKALDRKSVV